MSHLLLLLPMACRFERWRREIMPDLNAQLDVWTHEVMDLVDAAEAALSRQVQETMMPQLGAGTHSPVLIGCHCHGSLPPQSPLVIRDMHMNCQLCIG